MPDEQLLEPNPLKKGPQPDFPEQPQDLPGSEAAMQPTPDHGEKTYKGSGRLAGKTAIITGGDSGIGKAIAIAFAREGADVLISYLQEEEQDAQDTLRYVKEAGRKAVAIPGDITNEAHCQAIVERAVTEFGRLDILVNNAAMQKTYDSILDMPSKDFDRIFKTNVYATFWLCKAAVPHLKAGASIINTSSIQAYNPSPSLLPYSSTKGAIVTFSKGLAQELIKKGIRVNVVAPGPVWTPLIPATMPMEQVTSFGSSNPMERPAQPAELAPAYVFLASEDASFVVGEVLGVNGGLMMP